MKITFEDGFPKGEKAEVKRLIMLYASLLKYRCEDVSVRFQPVGDAPGEQESVAAITPYHEYRCAVLHICPKFLMQSEEEKHKIIAHEVSHFLTNPLREEAFRILEHFAAPKEAAEYAISRFTASEEAFVEDLARFLVDLKVKE